MFVIRNLLTLIVVLFCFKTSGQVTIDPELKTKYNKAKKEVPKIFEELVLDYERAGNSEKAGITFFDIFHVDTLNKNHLILSNCIEVDNDEMIVELMESGKNVFISSGKLIQDTLKISLSFPFGNQTIIHEVTSNKVTTSYVEKYKDDLILMEEEFSALTQRLSLPIESQSFALSTNEFSKGEVVYGYSEFETPSYFKLDYSLNDQLIHLKWRFKYYFSFTVK